MAKGLDILITAAEIQKKVEGLAGRIGKDYQGKNLVVVGVLKGSFVFMADLIRQIPLPLACDFLRVASYDQDRSTGIVRMEFDMTQPVAGKDVLLVEDIVDSGRTLTHLLKHLEEKKPASLRVCSLLFKEVGSGVRDKIDYLGFTVPNRYVVGFGLDSEGLYRSLPYVAALR
ncbi:MAG: hypoxanthine phosphoribosyltransferase [Deltaproteobacteria bacterium]|nr:hypoxanthine phosphoribosyltransferase [Deltaproteobacteria bacterium]